MGRNKTRKYQKDTKGNESEERNNNRSSRTTNFKRDSAKRTNTSGGNHISWYTPSADLLNTVGAVSFGDAIGIPIDSYSPQYSTVPGIAVWQFTPNYGVGQTAQDIRLAANKVWADVRAANSRSATYQPNDIMLYFMAMDQVYMLYSAARRAYGLARHYSVFNRYWSKGLVEAAGFDYEEVINNMADFRYYINQLALRLSHIPVPNIMPFITKHAWMCQKAWKETESPKTQVYMFRPSTFYKYDATAETTGGSLTKLSQRWTGKLTLAQFRDVVEQFVNALAYDDDITYMAGDIIKTYGESNFFYMEEVPETFVTQIDTIANDQDAYEVIVGMHNADIIDESCFRQVVQVDGNTLSQIFSSEYTGGVHEGTDDPWPREAAVQAILHHYCTQGVRSIDLIKPDPTPANIMYATRYMFGSCTSGSGYGAILDPHFPTEIITGLTIFSGFTDNGELRLRTFTGNYTAIFTRDANNAVTTENPYMSEVTSFKYTPRLAIYSRDGYDGDSYMGTPYKLDQMWSREFTTDVNVEAIDKLHHVAAMGMFGFHSMGNVKV